MEKKPISWTFACWAENFNEAVAPPPQAIDKKLINGVGFLSLVSEDRLTGCLVAGSACSQGRPSGLRPTAELRSYTLSTCSHRARA